MLYAFDEFEADDRLYELRRAGVAVPVEPRVFDLLLHLVRHRDRVVTRSELLADVWSGVVVSESALSTAVNALRKTLGAGGAKPPIQTVYGRGYRFVAPVREHGDPGDPEPAAAGAAAALAPPDEPFVGRAAALAALRDAVAAARGGDGRVVLLCGEPGIGKSRTAERGAEEALRLGFRVLAGRCPEAEGTPGYWPWVRPLRALLGVEGELQRARAGDVAALAQLLPELGREPVARGGDLHRFRVFDAVADWLARSARAAPLWLAIDDLQWADPASLELFGWLARELRGAAVLLVGTVRDEAAPPDSPLARTLAELARLDHAARIDLAGFCDDEVADYLRGSTGQAPPELVRALRERTDGNPFFLRETVRLLAADGAVADADSLDAWRSRLPPAARDVVRSRLAALPAATQALLQVAATIGRDFGLAAWAAAAGRPREEFLAQVDRAVAARVILPVPGAAGRARFSHALVRDALLDELPPGERAALHERVARALLALHGDDPGAPAAEIARHLCAAAARGCGQEASRWSRRAAREAASRGAYEEAALHGARALEALAYAGGARADERLEILLEQGDAQLRSGDAARTRETFAAAAAQARELGRAEDFVHAAIGYGGSALWGNRPDASERALLEEAETLLADDAVAMLPDDAVALRAMLAARLVATRAVWGALGPERPASAAALALARRSGDLEAISEALHARHFVLQGPDHLDLREALAEEILAIGATLGRLDRTFAIRETLAADRLVRGDRAGFLAALSDAQQAALASHHPAFRWLAESAAAGAALVEGRLADAERALQEASEHGRRARSPQALPLALGHTLALRRAQGRLGEIRPVYEGVARQLDWIGPFPRVALAMVYCETGSVDRAREVTGALAPGLAALERRADWLVSMAELAFVAAAAGDHALASVLHGLLAPYAGRHAVYPGAFLYAGPVSHALAALAALLGRGDEARTRFEDALAECEGVGAAPARARAACDLGALLAGSPRPAERARGRELVEAARRAAESLGMPPLARRAAELLGASTDS
jgi:DNA-binding winged helix-turn-helix (wHTH) protein